MVSGTSATLARSPRRLCGGWAGRQALEADPRVYAPRYHGDSVGCPRLHRGAGGRGRHRGVGRDVVPPSRAEADAGYARRRFRVANRMNPRDRGLGSAVRGQPERSRAPPRHRSTLERRALSLVGIGVSGASAPIDRLATHEESGSWTASSCAWIRVTGWSATSPSRCASSARPRRRPLPPVPAACDGRHRADRDRHRDGVTGARRGVSLLLWRK